MKDSGTSWEGTRWATDSVSPTSALERRVSLMSMVALLVVGAAMGLATLTAIFYAPQADASTKSGAEVEPRAQCNVTAYKPFASGSSQIGGRGYMYCPNSPYRTYGTKVWKNINNRPDTFVASSQVRSNKDRNVYAYGPARGCGAYYTNSYIKYRDFDRSNQYYRC